MGGVDQGDDLTFRVNFGGDGVTKLRHRVNDKLKEFMGDYTDDTLVEYVIVLLKNGRRKVEARNELNVFLGDDSDSFVSWLWDHLGSNLDLYVQPRESLPNEVAKTIPIPREQAGRIDSHRLESEPEREKPSKLLRSRHGSERKSLVRNADEPPPLRSVVTANFNVKEDSNQKVDHTKRSPSPRAKFERKRRWPDERSQIEREEVSKTTINAPRRLLQFAVRDAVGSPRSLSLSTEPSLKRLRSVVSTSTGDSLPVDSPQRIRSVARVPNATMAVAIKAVAEAAKDVVKVKSLGNVFDRLGRAMDVSENTDHMAEFRESPVKAVGEYRDFDHIPEETRSTYLQRRNYRKHYARNMTMLESDAGIASDFVSNNDAYEGGHILGRRNLDVSHTGISCGIDDNDLLMSQYNVASKTDESTRKSRKDQDQPSATDTSSKIVNISVNVNTWKPPHYQETREVSDVDGQKFVQESEAGADKSGFPLMKEKNNFVSVGNGNAIPGGGGQKESQKAHSSTAGLYSTGRATEDADSRTIFVSNVHFAATKDSLSRHFNKFGDVLKVVILMDAATGQPKGSAYVEFMRKEAAEHALSLDGTSFMLRILKVVRKSAAPQEAAPVMTWPRVSRGSIFAASRFVGVPFPRGIPGMYGARLPIKAGARSFQWKRDAQTTPAEIISVFNNSVPSPITPRSLTYVRAEPKINGNSSTV